MDRERDKDFGLQPLHHDATGGVIGYRVTGRRRGPRALAVARRADAGEAFRSLVRLPHLPWLRGELLVAFEEALDDPASGLTRESLFMEPVDGAIYIAFQNTPPRDMRQKRLNQRAAYWSVLRLCVRLGMIRGRGVPAAKAGSLTDEDESEPLCTAA